ncbi:hypothetical protein K435DRAFT_688431 [Dendrothele bispora CBS 962.96]|uniref:CxC1-like cysteine cluster associated with KDZ transposases domain-containing protein n=1 Tax=Dendrothele bispora (strain CBS 962.96) TaxID=1314807 RepID=A0A4S8L5W3_DENBC|nr:hypothetical protein K435DRAFT_688431 [Dendrothele bispora CBS 962.96]
MDAVTDAYVAWKHSNPPSPPSSHPEYDFDISTIDLYTLERTVHILRDEHTEPSVALVRSGYLGNSPLNPSLAIALRTLELFHTLRLFKASFSVEAFAKVLCHSYKLPYRRGYRTALSDAFDIYLAILRNVDDRVTKELGHNSQDYQVKNSCPACCYELEGEPSVEISRMWVIDGNNSLKCIKGVNNRAVADTRVFASDYYLSPEFVNQFANEVKARRQDFDGGDNSDSDEDDGNETEADREGDPTDGAKDGDDGIDPKLAEILNSCTENWKASAKDESKKMWGVFEECGIFASACRHGFILWIVDMIESGELAKYPLAIVAKALEVFGGQWMLGYDIGCRFIRTILSSSLGQKFQDKKCRACVNAFHGYSHNIVCQQHNHPLSIPGMGLEDLETLERVFSASNQLASITRYMSSYRRHVFIDIYFRQWDQEKYQNLTRMIHNNYVQALDIIEQDGEAVQRMLQDLQITGHDLDAYFQDEVAHFRGLGTEAPEDLHAVAYVELLQKFRALSNEYEEASSSFRLRIPDNYTPLSATQQYGAALSETRKAETNRRRIGEQRDQALDELVGMEVQMGIPEGQRWLPGSPQYLQALQYMKKRKYQQALESLYKLVVQRLFELHRLNLSQTSYKMRTHISQALQKRSNAIRNAVRRYNTAATALEPPRPTLDWSKVSHFSFLDEFNILQDTRHSVFDKPWAQANIRDTMKRHRRVTRAREEIIRCNIELRRLHTSIIDEEHRFVKILKRLKHERSPNYGPVHEYITRRRGAHRLLMEQIQLTHDLPGFTGSKAPGVHKREDSAPIDLPSAAPDLDPDDATAQAALPKGKRFFFRSPQQLYWYSRALCAD